MLADGRPRLVWRLVGIALRRLCRNLGVCHGCNDDGA